MTKIKSCASVLVGTALAATVTCCANKPVTLPLVNEERPVVALQPASAMPHVIIYKTTRDYSQNVPVIMDASRQRIRGIGENVAFLSYTYDEYAALKSAPTMQQLLDSIIDRYPLSAITDCGSRSDFSGNLVDAVNEYIRSHGLK